jgi:large subunit ribosomal protein L14
MLTVADNSGAVKLMLIHVMAKRKTAYVGDVINAIVKGAEPEGQVKDGDLVKAVIVRTRKEKRRKDGSYIRFSDNAAVVIDNDKDKNPKGTRIFGPVAREVKDAGFSKIASLAKEVL